MLKLASSSALFKNSGFFLFFPLLFIFIFGIPPFQSGTWYNTEPQIAALLMLTSAISLWLAIGIYKNWLIIESKAHPLVYGLIVWAILQFLFLPFSSNKIYSWMGLPQTGEGAAWQVMLTIFVFFFMALWQVQTYKKAMLYCAIICLAIMTYLQFNPAMFCHLYKNKEIDTTFLPNNFPDYLSFVAGWLWLIYACSPSLRTPRLHVFVTITCCLAIYISDSVAGRFILNPILLASGIMLFIQTKHKKTGLTFWKKLTIIGLLLPLFWIFIPLNQELKFCNNSSLTIRKIINATSLSTITHEPQKIIFGNGWGNFKDDMFKYSLIDEVHAFKDGKSAPNFTLLNGQVFHPHNQPVAALFALGIPGFLVFVLLPILALTPLRNNLFWWCAPIFIGINAISSLWFTLPPVLPFQALGLAAMCGAKKGTANTFKKIPNSFSAICLLMCLLFAASSSQQIEMIKYGERLKNIMNEDPNNPATVEWIKTDIINGGDRMTKAIMFFSSEIAFKSPAHQITEQEVQWFKNFLDIANYASIYPSTNIDMKKLQLHMQILLFMTSESPLDKLKTFESSRIINAILRFTEAAPQREDFVAIFLQSLHDFTMGDQEKQKMVLKSILHIAPNHRSALWLLGNLENNEEIKNRALDLGVEKVYPITKQTTPVIH